MRIAYFAHSLVSCWNHGNAHFLRGVLRELARRGHAVTAYEPAGAWSLQNLLRDHGEAAYVAPVVPLARGWSRQVDTDRNPVFYAGPLDAGDYGRWLRENAVDAGALGPSARADGGGRQERALLLIGSVPGLVPAWSDDEWRVWRFLRARPVAEAPVVAPTPPAPAPKRRIPPRASSSR